ncbi:1-deoxy-D-xylulose 5-phosphate reductoisomerase [Campylobacterota bacterium]|nr:1-deoxy-D-xylulose 5-phosphate reductoisomerase [Campylobacterota bacterium]
MVLLGSTGSIGAATLSVARGYHLEVETLVAGKNADRLNEQIAEFHPKRVVVADRATAEKVNFAGVKYGDAAILEAIEESRSDLVVNALVGSTGLAPTLKTVALGKRLALANKESLVCAGAFIDTARITPIDSEHFGIKYLLADRAIRRLIITASGGALRDLPIEAIEHAPIEAVLRHPNWSMGAKITIDSATMVNKLFELLEARWLFGAHEIDALIERSSAIHAMIEFADGCISAQASRTDMRLAIAYAVLGELNEPIAGGIDLTALEPIRFEPIDSARYPVWAIKEPLLQTPALGVVINAANEAAIERYRAHEISFGAIARTVLAAFERFSAAPVSIDHALALHDEVLGWTKSFLCKPISLTLFVLLSIAR